MDKTFRLEVHFENGSFTAYPKVIEDTVEVGDFGIKFAFSENGHEIVIRKESISWFEKIPE